MWGNDLWGQMIWGGVTVPSLSPVSLVLLLVVSFLAGGWLLRPGARGRHGLVALALICALPLTVAAVSVPHLFSNGTIADAAQVNANFAALEAATNVLETGLHQVGLAAPTVYAVDHDRYVVDAPPALVGRVVPLDVALTTLLCRDIDGCEVTLGMLNWNPGQPGLNAHRRFHFQWSASSGWWRTELDVEGLDGASGTQEVNAFDCYFGDAENFSGSANGRSDIASGFGLLNAAGGSYSDATVTCRVVLED